MVTTTALADLLRAGVRLDFSGDADRPIFSILPEHRPRVDALLTPDAKAETQHVLRQVAAYRQSVLRVYRLMAEGGLADLTEARRALQEEWRLVDDLGPRLTDLIRATAAHDYATRTGLCPLCGEARHDLEGDR